MKINRKKVSKDGTGGNIGNGMGLFTLSYLVGSFLDKELPALLSYSMKQTTKIHAPQRLAYIPLCDDLNRKGPVYVFEYLAHRKCHY